MSRVCQPGGFWRRAAALAVDWFWLFALAGSLSLTVFGEPLPRQAPDGPSALGIWSLHNLLPAALVVAGWRLYGTTPGKFLLDLRVVDHRTGGRPRVGRALLRYCAYFVSIVPLGLGFAVALANVHKRALHDYIAGTRVVEVAETDIELVAGRRT